ncbi:MAG: alpha/beta fold hydrolase, partial [Cyanobacteria bacterium J06598_1]
MARPVKAAEQVRLRYGLYELLITRQDLEAFAQTGVAEGDLKTLVSRLGDKAELLQGALQAEYELDPVLANRFAYTRSGVQLLTAAGEFVQTESGLNGFKALRAALTLAASDPAGLTMLSFLEHFPSEMRVSIGDALGLAEDYGALLGGTQQAVAQLVAETEMAAQDGARVDFSQLPDPQMLGEAAVSVQTLEFYDQGRDRTIPLELYVPEASSGDAETAEETVPVIVVSNGLGARRDRFKDLAMHLASHGFAVALPDHPGSDRARLQAFYRGFEAENFEPGEYIDRPLDVSFILDELSRLNSESFSGRLNPEQAGVFGYSFGGTTALALAGAKIDLAHLQTSCDTRSSLFNISLLYQCRALELPEGAVKNAELKDDRVQAIYVFVPFSRSLYGPEGMANVEGPVLWEATDKDILTPFVVEQLPAFSWLSDSVERGEDRYLAITAGLPHARITLEVLNRLTGQEAVDWEEIKPIAEGYHQTLSTGFFQVHLAGNER